MPLLQSIYILRILFTIFVYSTLALSWDLIAGYYRIAVLSFAHAALFCLGGYVSGLLAKHFNTFPVVSMFIGGIVAATIGIILALLCIRFPGRFNLYYIILSRTIATIIVAVLVNEWKITGGTAGITVPPLVPVANAYIVWTINYILAYLVLLSLVVLTKYIEKRPLGYAIRAIYEDEVAAQILGINTIKVKILMITLTAFYAGFIGGLYAHSLQVIGPDLGSMSYMLIIFFMAYTGGSGTIIGPILGAFLWFGLYELLRIIGVSGVLQKLMLTLVFLLILRYVGWKGIWTSVKFKIESILKKSK
ncbi:MAG: branched-chain amino acid ABC transporter permease [Saccharolobus sp.]|uniref:branched-chain amino acid ABC transporter permease n=1 Tax=Saccharolobus sp. TaxID=2100761 RepID=UPI003172B473